MDGPETEQLPPLAIAVTLTQLQRHSTVPAATPEDPVHTGSSVVRTGVGERRAGQPADEQTEPERHLRPVLYEGWAQSAPPVPRQFDADVDICSAIRRGMSERGTQKRAIERLMLGRRTRELLLDAFWWFYLTVFGDLDHNALVKQYVQVEEPQTPTGGETGTVDEEQERLPEYPRSGEKDASKVPFIPPVDPIPQHLMPPSLARSVPSRLPSPCCSPRRSPSQASSSTRGRKSVRLPQVGKSAVGQPAEGAELGSPQIQLVTSPDSSAPSPALAASQPSSPTLEQVVRMTTNRQQLAVAQLRAEAELEAEPLHDVPIELNRTESQREAERQRIFSRMAVCYQQLFESVPSRQRDVVFRDLPDVLAIALRELFLRSLPYARQGTGKAFEDLLLRTVSYWISGVERDVKVDTQILSFRKRVQRRWERAEWRSTQSPKRRSPRGRQELQPRPPPGAPTRRPRPEPADGPAPGRRGSARADGPRRSSDAQQDQPRRSLGGGGGGGGGGRRGSLNLVSGPGRAAVRALESAKRHVAQLAGAMDLTTKLNWALDRGENERRRELNSLREQFKNIMRQSEARHAKRRSNHEQGWGDVEEPEETGAEDQEAKDAVARETAGVTWKTSAAVRGMSTREQVWYEQGKRRSARGMDFMRGKFGICSKSPLIARFVSDRGISRASGREPLMDWVCNDDDDRGGGSPGEGTSADGDADGQTGTPNQLPRRSVSTVPGQ